MDVGLLWHLARLWHVQQDAVCCTCQEASDDTINILYTPLLKPPPAEIITSTTLRIFEAECGILMPLLLYFALPRE